MKLSSLTFDQDSKREVLELFDKSVDGEGFIVEISNPQQRVLTPKGEEILLDEWAGVIKGSEAFVKKDTFSLIELAKKME
jgi:hypothetical protein